MATQQQIDQNQAIIVNAAMQEGAPQTLAKLIASQGRLESKHFSSNVFLTDNNSFGMKIPSIRKSPYIQRASTIVMTAEGKTPYAHYKNLADSAKDVVHWLKFNHADFSKLTDADKYAAYLKSKGYYGDSQEHYTAMLYSLYDKIKDKVFKNPTKTGYVVIVVAAAMIMYGFYIIKDRKKLI